MPPEGESTIVTGFSEESKPPRRHRLRFYGHRRSRASRRPWFRCLRCGMRLFQVDVFEGHTAIRVGRAYSHGNVTIVCPNCLATRKFVSCSL